MTTFAHMMERSVEALQGQSVAPHNILRCSENPYSNSRSRSPSHGVTVSHGFKNNENETHLVVFESKKRRRGLELDCEYNRDRDRDYDHNSDRPIKHPNIVQDLRRIQCKARNMSESHNSDTAYFLVSSDAPHGMLLCCSHHECAASGRRFRYCRVCALPVAKRNFLKRHGHGLVETNAELTTFALLRQCEMDFGSSSSNNNNSSNNPANVVESSTDSTMSLSRFSQSTPCCGSSLEGNKNKNNNNKTLDMTSSMTPQKQHQQQHQQQQDSNVKCDCNPYEIIVCDNFPQVRSSMSNEEQAWLALLRERMQLAHSRNHTMSPSSSSSSPASWMMMDHHDVLLDVATIAASRLRLSTSQRNSTTTEDHNYCNLQQQVRQRQQQQPLMLEERQQRLLPFLLHDGPSEDLDCEVQDCDDSHIKYQDSFQFNMKSYAAELDGVDLEDIFDD